MDDFPAFMKSPLNHIDKGEQNTEDIDGYVFEGNDGCQMAFWTCRSDRVSKEHRHDFDEYMVCVQGQYIAVVDGIETVLNPGDELFIPKSAVQSGRCIAGTRTIHAFGGRRIQKPPFSIAQKRLSFDEDAANYDRRRPRYTREVFEDVIRYSEIGVGKRALEIGIGTGQATEPILRTGCRVTAVEIGRNLADYAREKLRNYPNLSVRNLPFEDFKDNDGSFDLIYAATAFHWIPEEIGFSKAFRLLKNGGTLALWWNRPYPDKPDGELNRDIQKVYEKYRPGGAKPVQDKTPLYRRIQDAISARGFTELQFRLFHAVRTFDADGYIELLNTYSDHRGAPSDKKASFESEIRQAIAKHGNRLTVYDTIDLYLARKPQASEPCEP